MKNSNELKLHDIREDFVDMLKSNQGKVVSPEMIDDFLSQSSFRINLYHHKALCVEYRIKSDRVYTVLFFLMAWSTFIFNLGIQGMIFTTWVPVLCSSLYHQFALGRKKAKVDIFGDEIDIRWP